MDIIARVAARRRLGERHNDVAYWRQRPPEELLTMLEVPRRRHHGWDDAARPQLQQFIALLRP